MKKTLLICLLGYLCVPTSTLKAQIKVAESPPGKDLVYQPGIPGQEGESSSARRGELLIYGEVVPLAVHSELTLELWEDPIDQLTHNPSLKYYRIPLLSGTLKTGNPGAYWFRKDFPLEKLAYLSIQAGEVELAQNLLVFPGDSIKFQWNERTSELAFAGPSVAWMTLQQNLLRLSYSIAMEKPTVIHSRNPAGMFGDENEFSAFKAAQDFGFGRTVEVWEINPSEMLRDLKEVYDTKSLSPVDALTLIRRYAGKIPEERLELLEAEELGKSWKHYWVLLQSLHRYSLAEPKVRDELISFFRTSLQKFNPLESYADRQTSPAYLEMNYEKVRLMQALQDRSALECISTLFEGEEKELMIAKQLFRAFPSSGMTVDEGRKIVQGFENTAIRKSVNDFLDPFDAYSPIASSKFVTLAGDSIGLDQYKGKTLLVHFWFTGCKASEAFYANALQALQEEYSGVADVQFISISVDINSRVWTHGLETGLYTQADWIQLYVGETGSFHPFLKTYGIYTYPHVMLIDKEGVLVQSGGFERTSDYLKSRIESVR